MDGTARSGTAPVDGTAHGTAHGTARSDTASLDGTARSDAGLCYSGRATVPPASTAAAGTTASGNTR